MTAGTRATPQGNALTAAILRQLRRAPNQEMALDRLADELAIEPQALQLAVERLHRRRFLIAPFVEPGEAGGAILTESGLAWLIAYEGGRPRDAPVALQKATARVRAEDEAARLPRAQVYGIRSPSPSE